MRDCGNFINNIKRRARVTKYLSLFGGILLLLFIFKQSSYRQTEEYEQDLSAKEPAILTKEFNLSMDNPVLEGISKDQLPYKITAGDITNDYDNTYNLNAINAKYNLADGSLIGVQAGKGRFDKNTKFFNLSRNVKVTTQELTLSCEQMELNLEAGVASSNLPVKVNFKNGIVESEGFCTENSNNIINFKGNVTAKFYLDDF